ncbi:hypothetical protein CKO25_02960 [Thiocapsa imhoffii]|uniref:cyclic-guanylate-specific phosphodiesterase n=1 Tax=Thiocapsa imhoffii TaxID=382777 RepID=A0A9X0WF98_9GAMM|nr:EAL domain-containing protein [Thiocapsa imhoffii]MBK1643634.1 hypothetical protein [Thiocapsa imhoffii]
MALTALPLGWRLGSILLLAQALLLGWVVYDSQHLTQDALDRVRETRLVELTERAGPVLAPLIATSDVDRLRETLAHWGRMPGIGYLVVVDPSGQPLAAHGAAPLGLDPTALATGTVTPVPHRAATETQIALQFAGQTHGMLHVGHTEDVIAQIGQQLRERSLLHGVIAFCGLLFVIILLTLGLSRRLRRVERAALAVAAGDLQQRLDDPAADEIGRVAQAFNEMATALRQRESALRETQSELERVSAYKYRNLLNATSDAVMLFDPQRGLYDCNPAAVRLFDCSRAQLIGFQPAELIASPWPPDVLPDGTMVMPSSENRRFECLLRGPDGREVVPAEVLLTQVALGHTSLLQMVARDIGARKAAEQALKHSEEKYRFLLEYSYDIVYLFNLDGVFTFASPSWSRLMGYSIEATLGTHYREYVHPDDLAICVRAFKEVIEQGVQRCDIRYRVRHADGTWRWHDSSAMPYRDEQGEVIGFQGIARDVTEQQAQDEQQRVAAIAFEAQEGMVVTDVEGVILRVNRAFTLITGYSAEEAIGQTPRLLKSSQHDQAFYTEMWSQILDTGSWQGEVWNRRKDGEIYPQWLTVSAVLNAAGSVTHYVGTLTDITGRKSAEEEIRALAFYDSLTRLPNRRLLLDRLQQGLTHCKEQDCLGAVFYIDLDDFKTFNDTLGHDQGDRLLQLVGQRLAQCISDTETLARLGGDEFVVMVSNVGADPVEALRQAEHLGKALLDVMRAPFELDGASHYSTFSVGATLFDGQSIRPEDLMKQADMAMYRAKAAGRNTLRFFNPAMQLEVQARADLEMRLREALRHERLLLHYQIQVDRHGEVVGAECLLRWNDPGQGLIPPDRFIPLAEESGLILPIGHWVLETACARLADWARQPETRDLTLAVNISARQFRQHHFVAQVERALLDSGADPTKLKLEITESLLLDDVEETITKMVALKARGVGFALDDFGTGYSSLSYLKRLPFDVLKIDRSFVFDILTDTNAAAIARTIIALGHTLDLDVIAEGVETEAQRDWLADQGCLVYQGYLFARPEPIERLAPLLRERFDCNAVY